MSDLEDWVDKELHRDMELQQAVMNAVLTADRIILEASDGSVEETNYLTSQVAEKFVEKVGMIHTASLLRKRLLLRD